MPYKHNKTLLFLLILIIKLIWILFINHHFKSKSSIGYFIAIKGADTHSYIEPIENFIHTGQYGLKMGEFTPFPNPKQVSFYPAIRIPHYGILYYFFRLFFEQRMSFELLAILQLIIEVFAILAFSKLVYLLTKKEKAFYLSLFFLTLSSWITFYASEIMTESLTCSFIMLGLYFYYQWITEKKDISLIITGFFIGYAVLMKPFLVPWILCFYFSILLLNKKIIPLIKNSFLFSLPFLLLWTPWVIRNYITCNELIIFTKPMYYPCKKAVRSCSDFLSVWGGDPIWWEGKCKTAGTYFFQTDVNSNCEYRFPDYVFTPDYSMEDFRNLRIQIAQFQLDVDNDSLDIAISKKFDEMKASFIRHRPFYSYGIAPLLRLKSSFIKSGSYYINGTSLPLKAIKMFQTVLYWLPLFFGTIGLFFIGLKRIKDPFNLVLIGLPFSMIITLSLIIKVNEWRYFIHIFPILIYFMIITFLKFENRFVNRGLNHPPS